MATQQQLVSFTGHAPQTLAAAEGFIGLFRDIANAVKAKIDAYRTENELYELSDAQLKDIGIGRSDIKAIARGKF